MQYCQLNLRRAGSAEEGDIHEVTMKMGKRLVRDGWGEEKENQLEQKKRKKEKHEKGEIGRTVEGDVVEGRTTRCKRKGRDGAGKDEMAKTKKRKTKSSSKGSILSSVEDAAEGLVTTEESDDITEPSTAETVGVKYVPPHLREFDKGAAERLRLERQIRGLLNRLSEANVESITADVSTIFQVNGRRLVTEIVTNEIVRACCDGPRGNDQFAAIFAVFIAGMSAMSGIDFGANVLAALAISFEEQYKMEDNLASRNLALLLSHMYSFNLLPSELIYEWLKVLCKRFEELDVATMLTILQFCGMALRGDDPAAMKTFVLSIQARTAEVKAALFNKADGTSVGLSKRVQFMLDTICEIKNNKRPSKELVPHANLKKWLQKLRVEDVQLQAVTWKGLLDPAKKGQWWLPVAENADHQRDVRGEMAGAMHAGIVESDKMLQLAASQRMNTDSRRAVFCLVMSGEDYIDAFEKILRMKLPGTQDREVLRVIVECCLQEKLFNKYYALLAAKLCDYDKNHKFTLQYCLWDHFKQLDTMELRRTANLARFLANVIGSFSLSLAVLKAVDFTDPQVMTSKVVMHFRILLQSLLMEYSEEAVRNIFSRVASQPELAAFRHGLSLFLHQNVRSVRGGKDLDGVLAKRCGLASKALTNITGVQ